MSANAMIGFFTLRQTTLAKAAGALVLLGGLAFGETVSAAALACKPLLSFKNVREIRPANTLVAPWVWKASVVADVGFCASRSGDFEIDFVRIKENSADLQFTENYKWRTGQFDVSIELAADESILEYRLGFVGPCVCRVFPMVTQR